MQTIPLDHEGAQLSGELFAPVQDGPHPAVLVMHSALGLGSQVRNVAAQLAQQGYIALATDMFGQGFDDSPAKAGLFFKQFQDNPLLMRQRAVAWFETLAAQTNVDSNRIGAIGYCFGGQCVLELARSGADVKAVSSFHGLLTTHAPATVGAIKGEVALWCGGKDLYAPPEHIEAFRKEMESAKASCQITTFANAEHGFTDQDAVALNRPGISYDALAHLVSWAGTLALLDVTLIPNAMA